MTTCLSLLNALSVQHFKHQLSPVTVQPQDYPQSMNGLLVELEGGVVLAEMKLRPRVAGKSVSDDIGSVVGRNDDEATVVMGDDAGDDKDDGVGEVGGPDGDGVGEVGGPDGDDSVGDPDGDGGCSDGDDSGGEEADKC